MKRIYGEQLPLWEKFNLRESPPIECHFKIGDKVLYTNDYGAKFVMDVAGFSKDDTFYGRFIHLVRHGTTGDGCAWWYPHHPTEISLMQRGEG